MILNAVEVSLEDFKFLCLFQLFRLPNLNFFFNLIFLSFDLGILNLDLSFDKEILILNFSIRGVIFSQLLNLLKLFLCVINFFLEQGILVNVFGLLRFDTLKKLFLSLYVHFDVVFVNLFFD